MNNGIEELEKLHGEVAILTTPSGYEVVIRLQTGEDDDVLSDPSGAFLGSGINKFVQGIIVKFKGGKSATYEDVEQMKLGDKYFIVIASRIFSMGAVMKFDYEWPDGRIASYEEDLTSYIWDYSKDDFPKKGDQLYSPYRIPPHLHGGKKELEFKITTKKEFKFTFMDGVGERYLMTLPEVELTKNTELKARGLKQKIGADWQDVNSFKNIVAKEMMEIREMVFKNDPIVEIVTIIPHPVKQNEKIEYPILASSDFLFPRGI